MSDATSLRMSRATIVVALVLAVLASGTNVSLLNSLMSASQIKSMAVVLLLFGIYWKRTSNAAGFAGLLIGGTICTAWYAMGNPFGVQPFWPGLVSSTLIIVGGSLIATRSKVSPDYIAYERRLSTAKEEFASLMGLNGKPAAVKAGREGSVFPESEEDGDASRADG